MNVCGSELPALNREWGQCAEELLFHTSRYAHHSEAMLRSMSGDKAFCMCGYRAHDLNKDQRLYLSKLLEHPPNKLIVTAVCSLVENVANGDPSIPRQIYFLVGPVRHHVRSKDSNACKHKCSTGLNNVTAESLIRCLARRYRFPVKISGRTVWLDDTRCDQLLHSPNQQIRHNLLEALQYLNRRGYSVNIRHLGCSEAA